METDVEQRNREGLSGSQRLLSIAQQYAPSGKAQQQCSEIYNDCARDNPGQEQALAICMAGLIYDGLAYGNWPWSS